MVNTIWFRVDLIRLGKNFSVCGEPTDETSGAVASVARWTNWGHPPLPETSWTSQHTIIFQGFEGAFWIGRPRCKIRHQIFSQAPFGSQMKDLLKPLGDILYSDVRGVSVGLPIRLPWCQEALENRLNFAEIETKPKFRPNCTAEVHIGKSYINGGPIQGTPLQPPNTIVL